MQQQWLVDISHELRTPLAVPRGGIEAMQDGIRAITRQRLDSLHNEVLHVSRIVNDLHDLSLIESGRLRSELRAVNPWEIIVETLECFRTRFDQRGIKVDVYAVKERDVFIPAGIRNQLRQLFSNILENTLRYTNVPGILKISFQVKSGRSR